MYSCNNIYNAIVIQPIVLECNNQTLTVEGMPFWFEFKPDKWKIAGTDVTIIEYIGTNNIGLLYLSTPINVEIGKRINITYKVNQYLE